MRDHYARHVGQLGLRGPLRNVFHLCTHSEPSHSQRSMLCAWTLVGFAASVRQQQEVNNLLSFLQVDIKLPHPQDRQVTTCLW